MPVYPENIAKLLEAPRYRAQIEDANAIGSEAKFDCGSFIRFEMRISDEQQAIESVRFQTNGCGFMAAAAESLASGVSGRVLTDLRANFDIPFECGPDRSACVQVAVDALRNAFSAHRSRKLEEFRGERPIICTCFSVAEDAVEEFVRAKGPSQVEAVTEELRAGGGCGSCRMLIQEIIDANV